MVVNIIECRLQMCEHECNVREKYILPADQAELISSFLIPMLRLEPDRARYPESWPRLQEREPF